MHFHDLMVERRLAGEPLQYVLGRWGFRSLDLFVDRRVLIPRPETEMVAGLAIDELKAMRSAGIDRPVAVDLGTGSGAIGLSIAVEVERAEVWITDASADALVVARSNLIGIGRAATRVQITEGSWFGALPPELLGSIDVIVSNPPYVATDDAVEDIVREWEPQSALFAGADGLDDIRTILKDAPSWLRPGGVLILEMDPLQLETVSELARASGFVGIETHVDLAGRDRALVVRRGN
jgi:release factor glutamine methyltransferase